MSPPDPALLRRAFGQFTTGVTVVTALGPDGAPVGFTANSFASVSLDPPLLLVCPGRYLSSFATFEQCRHFAVNILGEGQRDVSGIFAGFKGDRFAQVPHRPDAQGVPLIEGAVAQFSCAVHNRIPAGDHMVLIGAVEAFEVTEGRGLGYAQGQYFSLGLERAAMATDGICGAIIEDGDHVLLERTAQGLRPPQTRCPDRSRMRDTLRTALAARGIGAAFGPAYSVFDDAETGTQFSYLLAEATALAPDLTPDAALVRVPTADLPQQQFVTPAIAQMMTRFASEAQTRGFGLYLGDARAGDVHTPIRRS